MAQTRKPPLPGAVFNLWRINYEGKRAKVAVLGGPNRVFRWDSGFALAKSWPVFCWIVVIVRGSSCPTAPFLASTRNSPHSCGGLQHEIYAPSPDRI